MLLLAEEVGADLARVLAETARVDRRDVGERLLEFRGAAPLRRLDAPGRARLDTLLPRLLAAIGDLKTVAVGTPLDVLRRSDGHDILLPVCTERLSDFLDRRSGELSTGEGVTVAVMPSTA